MDTASLDFLRFGVRKIGLLPRATIHLSMVLLLLGMAVATAACGTSSDRSVLADQKQAAGSERAGGLLSRLTVDSSPLKIPSGTAIRVRLLNSISSQTASPGAGFDAELTARIEVHRSLAFPRGCRVRGRVVSARPSGRLHHSGFLKLTLDSLQTIDGKWVPVSTTSVSAHGKSHERRNLTLIGGGAGVGATIGALAGGGKGAAIGAASGTLTGTAGAYATGKNEVVYSAESRLTFWTAQEIVMKR